MLIDTFFFNDCYFFIIAGLHVHLSYDGSPCGWKVAFYCGFDLHFPNAMYIVFGEISTQIFAHFSFIYLFILFSFLRPHLQHMEVPMLGVESELQLPMPQPQQHWIQVSVTYTTAHGKAGSPTH